MSTNFAFLTNFVRYRQIIHQVTLYAISYKVVVHLMIDAISSRIKDTFWWIRNSFGKNSMKLSFFSYTVRHNFKKSKNVFFRGGGWKNKRPGLKMFGDAKTIIWCQNDCDMKNREKRRIVSLTSSNYFQATRSSAWLAFSLRFFLIAVIFLIFMLKLHFYYQ